MSDIDGPQHLLLIDGRWRAGAAGRFLPVEDPASGRAVAGVAVAEGEDLDDALAAAARGFEQWRRVPAFERAALLHRAAALIRGRREAAAARLSLEQGKPLAEAATEIDSCADLFDFFAEEGRRVYGRLVPPRAPGVTQIVRRDPIGPVAGFSPWNFPASQAVRKIGPALATGCSMILKGPEEAPGALIMVAEALVEAGLPDGVLNLVFGRPAQISEHLIPSPIIAKVTFTGSVPVGKHLAAMAAAVMKPCTMELGGHAPVLVFGDFDPEVAAARLAASKFRNAGQVCVSPTRFLVERGKARRFTEALAAAASALTVGPGLDPATRMGPLAHGRRRDAVESLVEDALGRGARQVTGGRPPGNEGYFLRPTVLADVTDDARIMREEPFGPVALVRAFDTVDEAIRLANGTPYGLAAYAFTHSSAIAARLADEIQSGMLGINHFAVALPELPFGGIKDSGFGREGGPEALDPYLVTRSITTLTEAA